MGCCTTLTGIVRDCGSNIGGIKKAWAGCFDEVGKPTITEGKITALGNTTSWKEYEFRKQTGSFTQTMTNDTTTGTSYVESEIVLQFGRQETSKRLEITALSASETAWIIQDNNDRFWYFGYDYGVLLATGTGETGTALGDFNGYNITLNDTSKEFAYEVSSEAMAQLLA